MDGNSDIETTEAPIAPVKKGGFKLGRFFSNQKEQEIEPKISVDIFFLFHERAGDIQGFEKRFKETDVYVPELAGWNSEALDLFRNVANGIISPEEAIENPGITSKDFSLAMFKVIHNSGKPIMTIDIPDGHPLLDKLDELGKFHPDMSSDFSGCLQSIRKNLEEDKDCHKEREEYMVSQLAKIQELIDEDSNLYPQLNKKKKLNVLLGLGAGHLSMYTSLREGKNNVRAGFGKTPIYDLATGALLKSMRGEEIDNDYLARIFLEREIIGSKIIFDDKDSDSMTFNNIINKITYQFNYQEVEELFNRLKRGEKRSEILADMFVKKNIVAKEELSEFLAKEPSPTTA